MSDPIRFTFEADPYLEKELEKGDSPQFDFFHPTPDNSDAADLSAEASAKADRFEVVVADPDSIDTDPQSEYARQFVRFRETFETAVDSSFLPEAEDEQIAYLEFQELGEVGGVGYGVIIGLPALAARLYSFDKGEGKDRTINIKLRGLSGVVPHAKGTGVEVEVKGGVLAFPLYADSGTGNIQTYQLNVKETPRGFKLAKKQGGNVSQDILKDLGPQTRGRVRAGLPYTELIYEGSGSYEGCRVHIFLARLDFEGKGLHAVAFHAAIEGTHPSTERPWAEEFRSRLQINLIRADEGKYELVEGKNRFTFVWQSGSSVPEGFPETYAVEPDPLGRSGHAIVIRPDGSAFELVRETDATVTSSDVQVEKKGNGSWRWTDDEGTEFKVSQGPERLHIEEKAGKKFASVSDDYRLHSASPTTLLVRKNETYFLLSIKGDALHILQIDETLFHELKYGDVTAEVARPVRPPIDADARFAQPVEFPLEDGRYPVILQFTDPESGAGITLNADVRVEGGEVASVSLSQSWGWADWPAEEDPRDLSITRRNRLIISDTATTGYQPDIAIVDRNLVAGFIPVSLTEAEREKATPLRMTAPSPVEALKPLRPQQDISTAPPSPPPPQPMPPPPQTEAPRAETPSVMPEPQPAKGGLLSSLSSLVDRFAEMVGVSSKPPAQATPPAAPSAAPKEPAGPVPLLSPGLELTADPAELMQAYMYLMTRDQGRSTPITLKSGGYEVTINLGWDSAAEKAVILPGYVQIIVSGDKRYVGQVVLDDYGRIRLIEPNGQSVYQIHTTGFLIVLNTTHCTQYPGGDKAAHENWERQARRFYMEMFRGVWMVEVRDERYHFLPVQMTGVAPQNPQIGQEFQQGIEYGGGNSTQIPLVYTEKGWDFVRTQFGVQDYVPLTVGGADPLIVASFIPCQVREEGSFRLLEIPGGFGFIALNAKNGALFPLPPSPKPHGTTPWKIGDLREQMPRVRFPEPAVPTEPARPERGPSSVPAVAALSNGPSGVDAAAVSLQVDEASSAIPAPRTEVDERSGTTDTSVGTIEIVRSLRRGERKVKLEFQAPGTDYLVKIDTVIVDMGATVEVDWSQARGEAYLNGGKKKFNVTVGRDGSLAVNGFNSKYFYLEIGKEGRNYVPVVTAKETVGVGITPAGRQLLSHRQLSNGVTDPVEGPSAGETAEAAPSAPVETTSRAETVDAGSVAPPPKPPGEPPVLPFDVRPVRIEDDDFSAKEKSSGIWDLTITDQRASRSVVIEAEIAVTKKGEQFGVAPEPSHIHDLFDDRPFGGQTNTAILSNGCLVIRGSMPQYDAHYEVIFDAAGSPIGVNRYIAQTPSGLTVVQESKFHFESPPSAARETGTYYETVHPSARQPEEVASAGVAAEETGGRVELEPAPPGEAALPPEPEAPMPAERPSVLPKEGEFALTQTVIFPDPESVRKMFELSDAAPGTRDVIVLHNGQEMDGLGVEMEIEVVLTEAGRIEPVSQTGENGTLEIVFKKIVLTDLLKPAEGLVFENMRAAMHRTYRGFRIEVEGWHLQSYRTDHDGFRTPAFALTVSRTKGWFPRSANKLFREVLGRDAFARFSAHKTDTDKVEVVRKNDGARPATPTESDVRSAEADSNALRGTPGVDVLAATSVPPPVDEGTGTTSPPPPEEKPPSGESAEVVEESPGRTAGLERGSAIQSQAAAQRRKAIYKGLMEWTADKKLPKTLRAYLEKWKTWFHQGDPAATSAELAALTVSAARKGTTGKPYTPSLQPMVEFWIRWRRWAMDNKYYKNAWADAWKFTESGTSWTRLKSILEALPPELYRDSPTMLEMVVIDAYNYKDKKGRPVEFFAGKLAEKRRASSKAPGKPKAPRRPRAPDSSVAPEASPAPVVEVALEEARPIEPEVRPAEPVEVAVIDQGMLLTRMGALLSEEIPAEMGRVLGENAGEFEKLKFWLDWAEWAKEHHLFTDEGVRFAETHPDFTASILDEAIGLGNINHYDCLAELHQKRIADPADRKLFIEAGAIGDSPGFTNLVEWIKTNYNSGADWLRNAMEYIQRALDNANLRKQAGIFLKILKDRRGYVVLDLSDSDFLTKFFSDLASYSRKTIDHLNPRARAFVAGQAINLPPAIVAGMATEWLLQEGEQATGVSLPQQVHEAVGLTAVAEAGHLTHQTVNAVKAGSGAVTTARAGGLTTTEPFWPTGGSIDMTNLITKTRFRRRDIGYWLTCRTLRPVT